MNLVVMVVGMVVSWLGIHVPQRNGDEPLGEGDNSNAIQEVLTVDGRSGMVVEGLADRTDFICRGDSQGTTPTVLIVGLLLRQTVVRPPGTEGGGRVDVNLVVMVVGMVNWQNACVLRRNGDGHDEYLAVQGGEKGRGHGAHSGHQFGMIEVRVNQLEMSSVELLVKGHA